MVCMSVWLDTRTYLAGKLSFVPGNNISPNASVIPFSTQQSDFLSADHFSSFEGDFFEYLLTVDCSWHSIALPHAHLDYS